ncbi:MAG TPA: phage/plasmid primase, P4 family [Candidatus Acidoferrales bacterium]|nr:phage/plasmid primase, P4 family [Candidatus Acidoferrales bacterium]
MAGFQVTLIGRIWVTPEDPTCGRFITPESDERSRKTILHRVMEKILRDFHANLLALSHSADESNAYRYLVNERKIHPQVVVDSMLGVVPAGYDLASKFDQAIAVFKAGARAGKSETGYANTDAAQSVGQDIKFLIEARDKFRDCTHNNDGWIAFFYSDANQLIVSVRFREPYSKRVTYFKPYKTVAGLFGHGLFAPFCSGGAELLDDFLIITEGEFNQLQLQSLCLRHDEITRRNEGYVFCGSVGGVFNADYEAICELSNHAVFCYDNDLNGAGFSLVKKAQETMSAEAFTTPNPDSDLDQFIGSFGDDSQSAWEAVAVLLAGRNSFSRTYSGTGMEFLRGKTFIPKRLAEAIMERRQFRHTASVLWAYTRGVYRPDGEGQIRTEAQTLLGEERKENRIVETLRHIETATTITLPDPNPTYINLINGRLNWTNGSLEPHSPSIFEVSQLPVAYDPAAVCRHFDHYLNTTLEPEIVHLVEELIGYCLIPDNRFEKAVLMVGGGENGKSVLLDTIAALLGNENVSTVALQDLAENRFRTAELHGKLANIFADLDDRALKSTSIFKTLVTGDSVSAERKFGQPFSFRPYARLIFSTNSLPPSRDRTHAFYRRLIVIPFNHTFLGKTADRDLRDKLRGELSGILNLALTGLRRLFTQGGFSEPQAVREAVQEYQQDNDTVASFVTEAVMSDRNGTIEKKILISRYRSWCEAQGLRPVGQKHFKASLKRIFPDLDQVRSSGGNGPWHWVGVTLTDDA